MTNLEYLESVKLRGGFYDDGDRYKSRKIKALEIIAEELIKINDRKAGLTEVYKDVVIDVQNLKNIIKKKEVKKNETGKKR